MSLIQIAAIYGSLKIFKFLLLQKEILFDENLQRYVNYGNNYEIIHLFELKGSYKYVIDDLIAFNRHDLLNYFLENYGNESDENEQLKKIAECDDDLTNLLNYQNLICAVSFFNIPVIVSCLFKISYIMKYDKGEVICSLLKRSEYDIDLFKFLFFINDKNKSIYGLNLFSHSINSNAFDTFDFLFHIFKQKIDFYELFIQSIKINSFFVNYFLDLIISDNSDSNMILMMTKSKITIDELCLAINYYDEDVIVKMIRLYNLIDTSEKQNKFIDKLAENLSNKMILSLFRRIIPFLSSDILICLNETLKYYEIFEVCEIIFEHLSKD